MPAVTVSEIEAFADDALMHVTLGFMKADWLKVQEAYLTDGTPLFTDEQKQQITQVLLARA